MIGAGQISAPRTSPPRVATVEVPAHQRALEAHPAEVVELTQQRIAA